MHTCQIVSDRWSGVLSEDEVIDAPSVDDFNIALMALDANIRTVLCIYLKSGGSLTIGGGGGQYVSYASFSENKFWNLIGPNPSKNAVMLNVGGQVGDFPARQIVDFERAQQAGITFMNTGTLDATLKWEEQR